MRNNFSLCVAMEFSFIQVLRRSLDGLRKYSSLDKACDPHFCLLHRNGIFLPTRVLRRSLDEWVIKLVTLISVCCIAMEFSFLQGYYVVV